MLTEKLVTVGERASFFLVAVLVVVLPGPARKDLDPALQEVVRQQLPSFGLVFVPAAPEEPPL